MMYTYKSFETLGAFTLLRPVFITMLIVLLLLLIMVVVPKYRQKLNALFVFSLSVIIVLLASQLLFYDAIIVDELGLGGDAITTYLYLLIVVVGIINPVIFSIKKKV